MIENVGLTTKSLENKENAVRYLKNHFQCQIIIKTVFKQKICISSESKTVAKLNSELVLGSIPKEMACSQTPSQLGKLIYQSNILIQWVFIKYEKLLYKYI